MGADTPWRFPAQAILRRRQEERPDARGCRLRGDEAETPGAGERGEQDQPSLGRGAGEQTQRGGIPCGPPDSHEVSEDAEDPLQQATQGLVAFQLTSYCPF